MFGPVASFRYPKDGINQQQPSTVAYDGLEKEPQDHDAKMNFALIPLAVLFDSDSRQEKLPLILLCLVLLDFFPIIAENQSVKLVLEECKCALINLVRMWLWIFHALLIVTFLGNLIVGTLIFVGFPRY